MNPKSSSRPILALLTLSLIGPAILTLTALVLSTHPNVAKAKEGRSDLTETRRELALSPRMVSLKGSLTCSYGAGNDGQPCALKLRETQSGRTFELRNTASAMKLFSQGTTNVSLEGDFVGAEVFQVNRASAL